MSVLSKMKSKKFKPGELITAMNEENAESEKEKNAETKNPKLETKETFAQRMAKYRKNKKKSSKGGGKGSVPKTKKGKVQVAKLGRKKKTGGFAKIAAKAGKKYGSKEVGKRVAGAIFNKMVNARKGA